MRPAPRASPSAERADDEKGRDARPGRSVVAASARQVRVVVTCTLRKSSPVPRSLRLRAVSGVRLSTRFRHWTERLANAEVPPRPALDLYAGEHWTMARRLADEPHTATTIDLWVCSAGYGLIPANTPIVPYSATFAPRSPDSVPQPVTDWWAALGDWGGPAQGPRRLVDLAASDPSARYLFVLSAAYLGACHDDVCQAAEKLGGSGRLSVLSAGTKRDRDLADVLLPADARLQAVLGGTLQALNIRAAEHLLRAGLVDHDDMAYGLRRLLAEQPPPRRVNRRRISDAEIRAFVRARRRVEPHATHTRLLRELRAANYACEQARFATLFAAETKKIGR